MIAFRRLLVAFLLLPLPARAEDTARLTAETFAIPAATWLKIPLSMRDDHALLRTTLIAQLPKGAVVLRDRIGGLGRASARNLFEAQEEVLVPSRFEASDTTLFVPEWAVRKTGSSFLIGASFGRSATMEYTLTNPDPTDYPLLQAGRRLDLERAVFPLFSGLTFDGTTCLHPVTLVAIVPDPDPRLREQRLLLTFLVAEGLPTPPADVVAAPAYTIELLGLRGSTRTTDKPVAEFMTNLLRRSDAHTFTLATTQLTGHRTTVHSGKFIPFPTKADNGPTGPVPTFIESTRVGSYLNVQLSPLINGKAPVVLQINHDWRDPILPYAPGKGEEILVSTRITYTMQHRVRSRMETDTWLLLDEQPLSDLFGVEDRDTKGESCYLFGRLVVVQAK